MIELKKINKDAIPKALDRAMRYRLINQPHQAESICRDVLAISADNQDARIILVLAMTDQFGEENCPKVHDIKVEIEKIKDDYRRIYYTGIAYERRASSTLYGRAHESESVAFALFKKAMDWYEKAEPLRPAGNDASILRWNSCVRVIERFALKETESDAFVPYHDG